MTLSESFKVPRSLDEWVGEEEHQGNHQAINRQGLHECQGQQQHTSQVICHLGLTGDAINASAGSNALANTRTNCSQANGEASANGGQSRDPHGALISKCCLWCHQSGRGQSRCGSSACSRSRHMGAAGGRHEGGQECTAAQQHGTGQHERASHSGQRLTKQAIYWRGCYCISLLWARVREVNLTCWTVNCGAKLRKSEVREWHVKRINPVPLGLHSFLVFMCDIASPGQVPFTFSHHQHLAQPSPGSRKRTSSSSGCELKCFPGVPKLLTCLWQIPVGMLKSTGLDIFPSLKAGRKPV